MEQASDVILATRTALSQASALAVQYSFSIVGAVILLFLGWMIARLLHNAAYRGLSRVHGIDETLARFFSNIIRYAILILVFITVLGQFGVQTASIIAALGAAGLAIGLALQGTLQNIAAGIMLLVLRPFRVGESIETSSVTGTVTEIGLFATELRTADGLFRLAPNSTLWNTPVTNYSRERVRRHDLSVTVNNTDDLDAVQARLIDMASSHTSVEQTPAPTTFITDLSSDQTTLTLRYWVATGQWWKTTREMLRDVQKAFYVRQPQADAQDADATV